MGANRFPTMMELSSLMPISGKRYGDLSKACHAIIISIRSHFGSRHFASRRFGSRHLAMLSEEGRLACLRLLEPPTEEELEEERRERAEQRAKEEAERKASTRRYEQEKAERKAKFRRRQQEIGRKLENDEVGVNI